MKICCVMVGDVGGVLGEVQFVVCSFCISM